MNIDSVSKFRTIYRNGPFAWPGGYPLYFITSDGAALSWQSARYNRRRILESIASQVNDGWRVVGVDVNWEDPALYCDDTGERIPSAYAEDEAAPTIY
jgi:hypothetical protein